jgi:hypothetical protein
MTTNNNTLYSNNARALLTSPISNSDTTLSVTTTAGFPTISAGTDYFFITADDGVNVEIIKVTGKTSTSFTGCVRGQEGTVASSFISTTKVENRLTAGSIRKFARLTDRLADYTSVSDLPTPTSVDGNSAICSVTDPSGIPIFAVVTGTKWRFLNYPDTARVSTVGSGTCTTTSLPLTGSGSFLIDTNSTSYILQFVSGPNLGLCRFLSISANNVSWSVAVPTLPVSTDTYEIYRAAPAKVPTGGGSDRIFFENEQTVWSNYSIPAAKNASSAGPIFINPGVTVTVPAGSSWSIV